jgi:ABC-type bacteriocin/lantibiotic exporter with double-glycine peptidase domain
LDEAFTAIEERAKIDILDRIYSPDLTWTIIDISHDADSIHHSDKIVLMAQGKVVEAGTASELIRRVDGRLEHLFPQLVQMLRIVDGHEPEGGR